VPKREKQPRTIDWKGGSYQFQEKRSQSNGAVGTGRGVSGTIIKEKTGLRGGGGEMNGGGGVRWLLQRWGTMLQKERYKHTNGGEEKKSEKRNRLSEEKTVTMDAITWGDQW